MFPFFPLIAMAAVTGGLAYSMMKKGTWGHHFPVLDAQGYPGGCESFHGVGVERCEHVYCQLMRNARRRPKKTRRRSR